MAKKSFETRADLGIALARRRGPHRRGRREGRLLDGDDVLLLFTLDADRKEGRPRSWSEP